MATASERIRVARQARIGADLYSISYGIQRLIDTETGDPYAHTFCRAETSREAMGASNEFSIRLDPDGPIYTVRVSLGGAIRP